MLNPGCLGSWYDDERSETRKALRNATREHRIFECSKRLRPQPSGWFGPMVRSFEGRFFLNKKKNTRLTRSFFQFPFFLKKDKKEIENRKRANRNFLLCNVFSRFENFLQVFSFFLSRKRKKRKRGKEKMEEDLFFLLSFWSFFFFSFSFFSIPSYKQRKASRIKKKLVRIFFCLEKKFRRSFFFKQFQENSDHLFWTFFCRRNWESVEEKESLFHFFSKT